MENEVVVNLADGCTLRSADPSGDFSCGDYVRLCDRKGREVVYWDHNEWEADPVLVMGAIINSAAGERLTLEPKAPVAVSEINYERLADLSDRYGVPFHVLCGRAENGTISEDELVGRPKYLTANGWITTKQAAEIMGVKDIYSVMNSTDGHDHFGLEVRKKCPGIMVRRDEITEVRRLHDLLKLGWQNTMRVFRAKKEGIL